MTIFKKSIKYYCLFLGLCVLSLLLGHAYVQIKCIGNTMGYVYEHDIGLVIFSNVRILLITIFSVVSLKKLNKANLELHNYEEQKQIVIMHAINSIVCFIFMLFPIIKSVAGEDLSYLFKRERIIDLVFIIIHIVSCIFCHKKIINNTNITTFKILFSFFIALLAFVGFFREIALHCIPTTEYISFIHEKVMGNDIVANILEIILFFVLLLSYAMITKKRMSRSDSQDSINRRNIKIITIVFAIELCSYCVWSFGVPVFKNIYAVNVHRDGIERSNEVARMSISALSSEKNSNLSKAERKEMIKAYENILSYSEQKEQTLSSYIQTLICQSICFVVSIALSITFLLYYRKILNAFCGGRNDFI